VAEMRYDGRGRRISKAVRNSVELDGTYHYYYDGDSLVEVRNGSDQWIRGLVWGLQYIDELIQVATEPFGFVPPGAQPGRHWAMQDSNWNVLGVVDYQGVLVERYEYTPYGERRVFRSAGADDPGLHASFGMSRRVVTGYGQQPFGICDIGHQGLMHDEELGLVYNRARMLHPTLGRFIQRDPLGYVDGMGLYEYVRSSPSVLNDPQGTISWPGHGTETRLYNASFIETRLNKGLVRVCVTIKSYRQNASIWTSLGIVSRDGYWAFEGRDCVELCPSLVPLFKRVVHEQVTGLSIIGALEGVAQEIEQTQGNLAGVAAVVIVANAIAAAPKLTAALAECCTPDPNPRDMELDNECHVLRAAWLAALAREDWETARGFRAIMDELGCNDDGPDDPDDADDPFPQIPDRRPLPPREPVPIGGF
jgi:RHS repeat-associated protein